MVKFLNRFKFVLPLFFATLCISFVTQGAELCQTLFLDEFVFLKPAPVGFVDLFGKRSTNEEMSKLKASFYTKESIYRGDVVDEPLTVERAISYVLNFQTSTVGNGIDPKKIDPRVEFSKLDYRNNSFNHVRRKYVAHVKGESNLYYKSGYTSWTKGITVATGFAHPYFMQYFDSPPDVGFAVFYKTLVPVTGLVAERAHNLKLLKQLWDGEQEVTLPVGVDPEMIQQITFWELKKKTTESETEFEGYVVPKKAIRITKISFNQYLVESGEVKETIYHNLTPEFTATSSKQIMIDENNQYHLVN